jgi:hypothetical protein
VGFEPTIPVFERAKAFHASDRADTVIGSRDVTKIRTRLNESSNSQVYASFRNHFLDVGFEVLTPVVMKSTIYRDITPCSLLKSQPTFQRNTLASILLGLFFDPEDGGSVLPKRLLIHGVISQKRELFISLMYFVVRSACHSFNLSSVNKNRVKITQGMRYQ